MKRTLVSLIALLFLCLPLSGCAIYGVIPHLPIHNEDWSSTPLSEEDLHFYDKDGNSVMALDPGDGSQSIGEDLSSYPDARTLRGIENGDKAINAIRQYPMPEGCAAYWRAYDSDSFFNDETTDWEQEIQTADDDGEILLINILLDENFNQVYLPDVEETKSYWGITFSVKDKVISDVSIMFYT